MISINALDPSQEKVLESLLKDESGEESDFSVVYGPPGTGKSHLIISLLFELARKGKKVLFVSQNTEALDVIGRMYRKLENDFSFRDNDASFLDFCLMLHDSSNRRLSYIKNILGRLRIKTFDNGHMKNGVAVSRVPYALTYTKDYDDTKDLTGKPFGMDELLRYYLCNVKHEHMLSMPIKNLSSIDVRKVLEYLDENNGKFSNFAFNLQPSGVLKHIAKTTPVETDLNTVHNRVFEIKSVLEKIPDDVKSQISSKNEFYILEYLKLIKTAVSANKYLNVKMIQGDGVNGLEFFDTVKDCVRLYDAAERKSKYKVPKERTTEIFSHGVNHKFLSDMDALRKCKHDARTIINKYQKLSKYGVDIDANYDMLLVEALNASEFDFDGLIKNYPGLKQMGFEDLLAVWQESIDWANRGFVYKALHNPGDNLLRLIPELDYDKIDAFNQYVSVIDDVASVLKGTELTLGELNNMLLAAKKKRALISSMTGVKEAEYYNVLQDLLIIRGSAGFIDDLTDRSLSEIFAIASRIDEDYEFLSKLVNNNKNLINDDSLDEVVENVNTVIRNRNKKKEADELLGKVLKYFRMSGIDAEDYSTTMEQFLDSVENGEIFNSMLENIKIADEMKNADATKIDDLIDAINSSLQSGIFADSFYDLNNGASLETWGARLDSILGFQDLDAFESFLEQHAMIAKVNEMIGEDNAENIKAFLASGEVSYDDYCERLSADLIYAELQGIPGATRAVIPENFFENSKDNNRKLRESHYRNGIKEILQMNIDGIKNIRNVATWAPGLPVMEQIRQNTEAITDAYPVIIATPKEVAKFVNAKKDLFDYVVFDEASQLLPGQALPSIYRAKKAVVIGDPHQMPPVSSTLFVAAPLLMDGGMGLQNDVSILDLAVNLTNNKKYHLMTHYRSKYNILFEPSRRAIYQKDGIESVVEAKSPERPPISIEDDLGIVDYDNFALIADRVLDYFKKEPDTSVCLLFTTMATQLDFQSFISNNDGYTRLLLLEDQEKLLISTVTNCQGIEGEHSILYFQHYDRPGTMWFFRANAGAYKRLNVSITRQRQSIELLMADSKSSWIEACQRHINMQSAADVVLSANLMMSLLERAGQFVDSEYLDASYGSNVDNVRSPLVVEIYRKLCEHYQDRLGRDLKIWCNVGSKMRIPDYEDIINSKASIGYMVDIAVYSMSKNKFIMGIETDGSCYSEDEDVMFVDDQRREVLENLKGWNIYRVWSCNWLRDPSGKMSELIRRIDEEL